jgi:hypothetical protein
MTEDEFAEIVEREIESCLRLFEPGEEDSQVIADNIVSALKYKGLTL